MPECAMHCTSASPLTDSIDDRLQNISSWKFNNKFIGEGSLFNHPIINPFYPFKCHPLCAGVINLP